MPTYNNIAGMVKFQYANTDIPGGNTISSNLVANPETAFTNATEIPASAFSVGTVVKIRAAGLYGTGLISLPVTIKVKSGSNILSTSTFTPVANLSNKGWEIDLTCNIFDLQTVEIQGTSTFAAVSTVSNASTFAVNMNNNVPISLSCTWGSLAVGGTIQLRQLIVTVT